MRRLTAVEVDVVGESCVNVFLVTKDADDS